MGQRQMASGGIRSRLKAPLAWRVALAVVATAIFSAVGLTSPASADPAAGTAPVPTTLTAAPISIVATATHLDLTFSATLTTKGTGVPLPGQEILFFLHYPLGQAAGPFPGVVCITTTDLVGVAHCTTYLTQIVYTIDPLGYSASFLGNSHFGPSIAFGYYTVSTPPPPKTTS